MFRVDGVEWVSNFINEGECGWDVGRLREVLLPAREVLALPKPNGTKEDMMFWPHTILL